MAEIVNLRRARKKIARAAAQTEAAANRVRFGTSQRVKDADRAAHLAADRKHDGHRRENGGDADT